MRTARERFEVKFTIEPSGCWQWIAYIGPHGYGEFRYNGKTQYAHRMSWMLYRGEIPEDKQVLHKPECHHRTCVNPDHLYLGTPFENVADKVTAGDHRRMYASA